MTFRERENEIKLDILQSLARSQRALSDMLEGIAAITVDSPELKEQLLRQLDILARYQIRLAEKISMIKVNPIVRGNPGKPWVHTAAAFSSPIFVRQPHQ